MCARYETLPDVPDPFAEYRITWISPRLSETMAEMFPGYLGPVIRLRRGERGMDAMKWGLIPYWAKDPDPKRFRGTFNARAETVDTIPSFSASFARRRCLIPASAFVEFPVVRGRKIRHRVSSGDGGPILFAGLWDRWRGNDEELYTFTVITTEPNEGLRWLHHRIPAILPKEAQEVWMDPSAPVEDAKRVLRCPDPETLLAVPVEESLTLDLWDA